MDVSGVARSGMLAASAATAVTANNVANLQTPGFQAKRPQLEEQAEGGVRVAGLQAKGPADPGGGSNVDLSEEMTDLGLSKSMMAVQTRVSQAADERVGMILDLKA